MKHIKSIIAIILTALIVVPSVILGFSIGDNTYMDNPRFHKVTADDLYDMYESGQKFVAVICATESDGLSTQLGTEVLTTWMDTYKKDIYALVDDGTYIDEEGYDCFGNEIPDYYFYEVADKATEKDEDGDVVLSYGFTSPAVFFVDHNNEPIYEYCFDDNGDFNEKAFEGFVYSNSGMNPKDEPKVYDEMTAGFKNFWGIEDKHVVGIDIYQKPDKTVYLPGETFDPTGLAVRVNYADDSENEYEVVESLGEIIRQGFEVSQPDMDIEAIQPITVTYKVLEDNVEKTFTTSFKINVRNCQNYDLKAKFSQDEARAMIPMVNAFRADKKRTWYWNENNTKKVIVNPAPVVYDYTLEKIAMERAAEIAAYYSHTRPNAVQRVDYLRSMGYTSSSENISVGIEKTEEMFVGFEEEMELYNKQGHRRNMLSEDVNVVGIACACFKDENGIEYKFWVQEFGHIDTPDTTPTEAVNGEVPFTFEIANTFVNKAESTYNDTAYSLELGSSAPIRGIEKTVVRLIKPDDLAQDENYPNIDFQTVPQCIWQTSDSNVAVIDNGNVKAVGVGETTIYTTVAGKTVSVPVKVDSFTPVPGYVTFVAEGVKVAEIAYDEEGLKADEPAVPEKEGYDGVWEDYSLENPNGIIVMADYTLKTYTATFKDDSGSREVKFNHGDKTIPAEDIPTVTAREGYTAKWGDYTLNNENITVEADYEIKTYTATFKDDSGSREVKFNHFASELSTVPKVTAREGYNAKWADYALSNEDITIEAEYEIKTYTATFDDGTVKTQVKFNHFDTSIPPAKIPSITPKDGYTAKWKPYTLNNENITVEAEYTPITYTATFKDASGEKKVQFGYFDTELEYVPAVTPRKGYSAEWEPFTINRADITVNAIYTLIGEPKIAIKNHGNGTTIDAYKKQVVSLSAVITDKPDGAVVNWYKGTSKVATGEKYNFGQTTDDYTVKAELVSAEGEKIASTTVNVKMKRGFFDIIVAFFKNLFKTMPTLE